LQLTPELLLAAAEVLATAEVLPLPEVTELPDVPEAPPPLRRPRPWRRRLRPSRTPSSTMRDRSVADASSPCWCLREERAGPQSKRSQPPDHGEGYRALSTLQIPLGPTTHPARAIAGGSARLVPSRSSRSRAPW